MNIGLAIALICLALFVGFTLGAVLMSDKLRELSDGTLYISKDGDKYETYVQLNDGEKFMEKHGYAVFFIKHLKDDREK